MVGVFLTPDLPQVLEHSLTSLVMTSGCTWGKTAASHFLPLWSFTKPSHSFSHLVTHLSVGCHRGCHFFSWDNRLRRFRGTRARKPSSDCQIWTSNNILITTVCYDLVVAREICHLFHRQGQRCREVKEAGLGIGYRSLRCSSTSTLSDTNCGQKPGCSKPVALHHTSQGLEHRAAGPQRNAPSRCCF